MLRLPAPYLESSMSRPLPRFAILACALALGCGGGGPYYRLDWAGADTVTMTPGETLEYPIIVQRLADNLGEVRVSQAGGPQGVTFGPPFSLPEGQTRVDTTATITVDRTVTAYGVNGIVLAAEDPANNVTANSNIAVAILQPPEPASDFAIAVEPRQVNLIPGRRAPVTVTVTRAEGFTGPLVISLESPSQRLAAEPLTLAEGQTSAQTHVTPDRSLNALPYIVKFVATAPDGRVAKTGFTFNVNLY
jgi:methionine-rich copper-binding protein CopC